ncbi:hypothetical protein SAMN05428970_0313 [Agromyces sp. CF514]|uniref:hypothetical protein n=1 Tax=Agromyces sp. CF514 TaxID=1881031 RepID=UPI0008E20317|nr:hypothetical protein [Agromyces sp. CF514]SFR67971.1 hypothetical protein SAMN05428970_0313 [Agromyces sp. CF514]
MAMFIGGVRAGRRAVAAAAAGLALAASFALAGCSSSGSGSDASPSTTATAGQLPPVIVDLADADGTTVEVALGNSIDLVGDEEHYTAWTAEIADPSIVKFVPGHDDGSAQFNPGLTATAVGQTEVSLSNSESGDEVALTVVVTE